MAQFGLIGETAIEFRTINLNSLARVCPSPDKICQTKTIQLIDSTIFLVSSEQGQEGAGPAAAPSPVVFPHTIFVLFFLRGVQKTRILVAQQHSSRSARGGEKHFPSSVRYIAKKYKTNLLLCFFFVCFLWVRSVII